MDGYISPSRVTKPYQYQPLDVTTQDVRLVELLPGSQAEDIHVRIHHVTLPYVPGIYQHSGRKHARIRIQATLKDGWVVRETIQGRFLFEHLREYTPYEKYETRWTHPFTGEDPNKELDATSTSPIEPAFEALSHAWGPKGDDRLIYVEMSSESVAGQPQEAIQIRSELDKALRHLRWPDASRMLWVDMICINQDDIRERGHQVKHMRLVYQLAHQVVVWLGQEDDNSSLAFAELNHLGKQVEYVESGTWRVNAPGCDHPEWSRVSVELPFDDRKWTSISRVVRRPWFQRLWVWQEAKLARENAVIKCGKDEMPLRRFGYAVWCAASKQAVRSTELESWLFNAGLSTVPQLDGPFMTTLMSLNQKQCLDPRDRIYGALGLAPSSLASRVSPDYSRSVAEVYRTFCLVLCKETSRLDFMVACNLGKRTINGPTWVPDWSVATRRIARWFWSSCHASGISIPEVKSLKDKTTRLEVAAIRCGLICSVRAPAPDCEDAVASVLEDWEPVDGSRRYITGESVADAFVKTLRWGFVSERFPKEPSFPTMKEAKDLLEVVKADLTGNSQKTPQKSATRFPQVPGCTYFETDNYMGITSAAVSVGDVVSVVLGCSLPVVLRPDRQGRFRVVGTAYVHGLMDIESLVGNLKEGWTVQIGAHSGWFGAIHYRYEPTGEVYDEDPRLGSLPPGWEAQEADRLPSDPLHFVRYKHLPSNMEINGDPRLRREWLECERGRRIETLTLI